jgi:hypothetical protein
MTWKYDTGWKVKFNNAPGRLWRFIDNNLTLSKTYLEKFRAGKIPWPPVPYVIDFKDWYKEE